MKKILTVLLAVALCFMVFTGCGNESPTPGGSTGAVSPTPTPGEPGTSDGPSYTPIPEQQPNYDGNIIKFNLYDPEDMTTRWTDSSKEWMLQNYQLQVDNELPAIEVDLSTVESRSAYNYALGMLFSAEATRPDYMPCLQSSSIGDNAAFKALADYLVDFNPYLQPGGLLYNYVTWVWADDQEYFEEAKAAIETSDGKLFGLPRREMLPVQKFLGYAKVMLNNIAVSWDDLPTTWDGFIELLNKFKTATGGSVPFAQEDGSLASILTFVLSTYGLTFDADFSWKEKNGEPLWSYYWDEYRYALDNVKMMAENGLCFTDRVNAGKVLNYDMEMASNGMRGMTGENGTIYSYAKTGLSIASYTTSATFAQWSSHGGNGYTDWFVSDTMVAQDGYESSLVSGTQFDHTYFAVGNRLGEEFAKRVMDMLSFSASDDGYITYFFGKEGVPFADTKEEAGCFIWVDDEASGEKRIRFTVIDRFGGTPADPDYWIGLDEHFAMFKDKDMDYGDTWWAEGDLTAEGGPYADMGLDTHFWARGTFLLGTTFYADITSYPMQMTVYWEQQEQMSKDSISIEAQRAGVTASNSYIYEGFYPQAKEYLSGSQGSGMQDKIDALKQLAKDFTIGYLGGTRDASSWTSYIKSLEDAGYKDVYEFYSQAAYLWQSEYVEGTKSQSTVNAQRGI